MAAIPLYWYFEPVMQGELSEHLPVDVFGPIPLLPDNGGFVVVVDAHGEIHGHAILMCALPWPRFRVFSTGQKVVLPRWMTETLEGFEASLVSLPVPPLCAYCRNELLERRYHFRVEVKESKVFPLVVCDDHFSSFPSRAKSDTSSRVQRDARYADRTGEHLSGASPNANNGYRKVKQSEHYISAESRVLDI